jgi:hypothetical protein
MKKIILILSSLVLIFGLYAATLKGINGNVNSSNLNKQTIKAAPPFESSHERATFAETITLVETGKFNLSLGLANFGAPDVGLYQNKFYSLFPPGISISLIPFYLIGQKIGFSQLMAYATIPLYALLSLILLYKISRDVFKLSPSISFFLSLVFGFASFAWAYSITIYQHIPTAFLILVAFYFGWKLKNKNSHRFYILWGAISWAAIGISIFFDYPNAFLMVPVVFYILSGLIKFEKVKEKVRLNINLAIPLTAIFFVLAIGLHFVFSHGVYGNWVQTTNTVHRYDTNFKDVLTSSQQTNVSNVFLEERFFQGIYLLSIAPEKGLFIFAPILVLSIFGLWSVVRKQTTEKWLLVALPLMNLVVYASFGDPWGGWAFGPRYLIPSVPFLVILIGLWMQENRIVLKKAIAYILFSISGAIAIGGALTTNLVPPKIEAVYLKIPYGLQVAWLNMTKNQSSSYLYNTYFESKMSLFQYALILFVVISLAANIVLFIIPIFYED